MADTRPIYTYDEKEQILVASGELEHPLARHIMTRYQREAYLDLLWNKRKRGNSPLQRLADEAALALVESMREDDDG